MPRIMRLKDDTQPGGPQSNAACQALSEYIHSGQLCPDIRHKAHVKQKEMDGNPIIWINRAHGRFYADLDWLTRARRPGGARLCDPRHALQSWPGAGRSAGAG